MNDLQVYSVTETAKLLGVTRQTVLKYIHNGELEAYMYERYFKISKQSIEKFLESKKWKGNN